MPRWPTCHEEAPDGRWRVRDPDIARRGTVWPRAASFGGLAVIAAIRTLAVGAQSAVGLGVAAWLVLSALLAGRHG